MLRISKLVQHTADKKYATYFYKMSVYPLKMAVSTLYVNFYNQFTGLRDKTLIDKNSTIIAMYNFAIQYAEQFSLTVVLYFA